MQQRVVNSLFFNLYHYFPLDADHHRLDAGWLEPISNPQYGVYTIIMAVSFWEKGSLQEL